MKIFFLPGLIFCCFNVLLAQTGPVAANVSYTFADSVTAVALDVLSNDSDTQNKPIYLAAAITIDSSLGSISLDAVTQSIIFFHAVYSCGSDTFKYVVCDSSQCDTGLIFITVNCPDNIFLPQGFSPNGDGINDLLVFTGLEYFEPASLKVFNRYGTVVFEDSDYRNTWNGTDIDSQKPLPDGTYFYILQLSNSHIYHNYLVINR